MGGKGSKLVHDRENTFLLSDDENDFERLNVTDIGGLPTWNLHKSKAVTTHLCHVKKLKTCKNQFGGIRSVPYMAVQSQLRGKAFDNPNLRRWIPSCPVRISIQDTFFKDRKCWYVIEIEHGSFQWTLQRCYQDFFQLHRQLQIHRTVLTLQLPDIRYEKERNQRRLSFKVVTKKVPKLPKFPSTTAAFQRRRNITSNMEALEEYLQTLLNIPSFKDYHEMLEFLEIGPYSFVEELGLKSKEGFVKRRSNCGETELGMMCTLACRFRKKRWLFLKENFVGLVNPFQGELECVLLLDQGFRTKSGRRRTGHSNVLVIQNLSRKLILQCESKMQAIEWSEELSFALDKGLSDFVTPNRYESFAPPRSLMECKWIVDGATYFDSVAVAMDSAKEEIFIADWWLSPEIYLRRPTTQGHYWQLDYLLKRKAREGVKIYILLYKELELAMGINSLHSELRLSKMHPNIQVLRHPYVSKGVLLWAHHEKLVCVDQKYAFVGGLDLCYGRWDDYQHRLTDLGEVQEKIKVRQHICRNSKESLGVVQNRRASSLPAISEILKPIDKNMGLVVENAAVNTVSHSSFHFEKSILSTKKDKTSEDSYKKMKLKTFIRKYQAMKHFESIKKQLLSENAVQQENETYLSSLDQRSDRDRKLCEMALIHLNLEKKYRLWHGKDYVNFINKDLQELYKPYSDMIDRSCTPRMPWHDVGLFVQGMVARDIARHFILRWNHAKEEICLSDTTKPFLMPKSYSNFVENDPPILQGMLGSLHRAECQVLRSLCFWSANIHQTENSIHRAYLNIIRGSKKFIYIENQFFISQPNGSSSVYNGIADALFNRILKAYRDHSEFHVFVVLPLLPAFEGEVGTGSGTLIQAVTHWNYKSICKGPTSLKYRLERHMKNASKFISFYGLRTHGTLNNKPVTELIYVHSKILIADDQVAIIGSANINDRSLLGRRDSEIAVIVQDTNFLKDPPQAGEFCHSLRCSLFKEHLGMMQQRNLKMDIRDPSKPTFFQNTWNKLASENTQIYEEVFKCIPTDKVTTFAGLKKYQKMPKLVDTDPEVAKEKLKHVQGNLVLFPLHFLCDEKLQPRHTKVEHYLPKSVFT